MAQQQQIAPQQQVAVAEEEECAGGPLRIAELEVSASLLLLPRLASLARCF